MIKSIGNKLKYRIITIGYNTFLYFYVYIYLYLDSLF